MPDKVTKSAAPSFLRAKRKNAGSPSHGPSVQGHTPQSQRKASIQAKINQSGIQTKLKVTPANDPSEREADHMAEQVVHGKKGVALDGANGMSPGQNGNSVAKWSKIYESDSRSTSFSGESFAPPQSQTTQLMRKWNTQGAQRSEQEEVDRVVEKEGMEVDRMESEEVAPMSLQREEEVERMESEEVAPMSLQREEEVERMESEEVAPMSLQREEEVERMESEEVAPMSLQREEEVERMESEEVAPMSLQREEEVERMESEEVAPMSLQREEEVERMESEEVAPMSLQREEEVERTEQEEVAPMSLQREEEVERTESEEVAPMSIQREEEVERMEQEEVAPMSIQREEEVERTEQEEVAPMSIQREEEVERTEQEEVAPMSIQREEEEVERTEQEEVAPMSIQREEEVERTEQEEVAPMSIQREEEEVERTEQEEVAPMAIQREEEEVERTEQEEVAPMAIHREEEEVAAKERRNPKDGFTAPDGVHSRLRSRKGKGRPLPGNVRGDMEAGFGTSFEGVRIHDDRESAELNQSLMARAFTFGNDIFFGQGEFQPNNQSGRFLLAHELTHTIQQGAVPAPQRMEEENADAQRTEEEAVTASRTEEETVSASRTEEETVTASRTEEDYVAAQRTEDDTVERSEEETVQASFRDLIDELLDLADWVGIDVAGIIDNIPGYTLFSYVIEYDVIRGRSVEPSARNLLRGLMGLIPLGNLVYEKLEEYGIIDKAFEWVEGALSRLNLSVGRLESAISSAWDQMGISEGISGNMRILQRHFEPIYDDVVTFASDAADTILELIKEALLKPLVEFLEENSEAYVLATKVLGRKFPLEDPVEAETVEILEGFLLLIGKETEVAEMQEKGTLQETADWIDTQLSRFFELLGRFTAIVDRIWNAFTLENLQNIPDTLDEVWTDFKELFLDFLEFAAEVALKVLELIKNALLAYLASFADEIPGFHLVTVIIEKNPFTEEEVPRTTENLIRGFMSLVPGGEAKFQQLKESGVVPRAAERIDTLVAELGISWAMIRDTFIGIWDSLSIDDLLDPIAAFQRITEQFGEPVGRIFSFISQVVMIVIELILEMMNFPLDLIRQIIANTASAFDKIKSDPIAFLVNLLDAVKLGFTQFFNNIVDHLLGGLQTWLFGELGTAGITPPQDLSFQSILGMAMDILGITVDNVLERLALKIGQEKVDRIRGVLDTLTGIWAFVKDVIERGPIAIWEYIQEKISDLWNMILGAIQNWIMTKIVAAVTTKLLSMLDPTGVMAVINSFIAFYSAVQSFIEKLREILEIINTFVKGVLDIANGNIQNAANFLEQALSDGIPVAIAFLANQVGLGNLGTKISEMIEMAREKINEGIDWLIDKAMEAGQAFLRMLGMGEEEEGEEPVSDDPEENHRRIGEAVKAELARPLEDEDLSFEEIYARKTAKARELEEQYQPQLEDNIRITITYGSISEEEPDGDIDFTIVIAPNDWRDVVAYTGQREVLLAELPVHIASTANNKVPVLETNDPGGMIPESQVAPYRYLQNMIYESNKGSIGDGSLAFISMVEQFIALPGENPRSITAGALHYAKQNNFLDNYPKVSNTANAEQYVDPAVFPNVATMVQTEVDKTNDSNRWIAAYNAIAHDVVEEAIQDQTALRNFLTSTVALPSWAQADGGLEYFMTRAALIVVADEVEQGVIRKANRAQFREAKKVLDADDKLKTNGSIETSLESIDSKVAEIRGLSDTKFRELDNQLSQNRVRLNGANRTLDRWATAHGNDMQVEIKGKIESVPDIATVLARGQALRTQLERAIHAVNNESARRQRIAAGNPEPGDLDE